MMNHHVPRHMDEAEKPFWISYSDLMTALMILFLVVMVASLTSISQQAIKIKTEGLEKVQLAKSNVEEETQNLELERLVEIQSVCTALKNASAENNLAARVDCNSNRIDFGEAGRFGTMEYKLNAQGEQTLKTMVPMILEAAQSPSGERWLKRIHIQGFTDTDGSYLYNLNLSLKRSEWVMCKILGTDTEDALQLTPEQRSLVKQLFLAGGVSFNDAKSSKEDSRRVELKLEFYEMDGTGQPEGKISQITFPSNAQERCQI